VKTPKTVERARIWSRCPYVVDSTKKLVTSAETRIAEAKVDNIHFGFDKVVPKGTKEGEVE
jgi:hypothetical protein